MNRVELFNEQRSLLFSIAYRMLGSVMDAEDMVQEAFVRWHNAGESEIKSPKAFLSTVITHLCIDYLRSAKVRRETYVGAWLPEPLMTEQVPDVAATVELAESLSLAFLYVLESLSPVERAVYLLRQVFDYDYSEIALIIGKSEANCRQIVRRAQQHLSERRPRYTVSLEERRELTLSFMRACGRGDMAGLVALLADDVIEYSDGGGKVPTARNPIYGADKVARLMLGLSQKIPSGFTSRLLEVNGELSIVFYADKQPYNVLYLDIAEGRIRAIYNVVNPDKLHHIPPLAF